MLHTVSSMFDMEMQLLSCAAVLFLVENTRREKKNGKFASEQKCSSLSPLCPAPDEKIRSMDFDFINRQRDKKTFCKKYFRRYYTAAEFFCTAATSSAKRTRWLRATAIHRGTASNNTTIKLIIIMKVRRRLMEPCRSAAELNNCGM